jgi:protein phosphatase 1G
MQGWRKGMEDAHITHLDLVPGEVSIFGVFDGHGGQEVAQFVEDNFLKEISKLDSFKSRDYKKALTETFINLDNLMLTDAGTKQVAKIARKNGTLGPGSQVDEKELVF